MNNNSYYYTIVDNQDEYYVSYLNMKIVFIRLVSLIFFISGILLYSFSFGLFDSINYNFIVSNKDTPSILPISNNNLHISSGFKTMMRPNHNGIDISGKSGLPIMATADGIIVYSGYQSKIGYGNLIKIKHKNGYETRYGHLSKRLVKINDKVKQGQIIGKLGNTGKSTAPHLHYEVIHNNKPVNPVNYF